MLAMVVALTILETTVQGSGLGANQLLEYLNDHKEPAGIIHNSYGYPVTHEEANLGINRDSSLLLNHYIYESMSSFSLERIPPRANHANGAAAHGYFEVTHDISKITNIKHFNKVGKRTPIFMRFSPTVGEVGSSEVAYREKGSAIKFYTEEGIMDLTGLSANIFAIKDPVHGASFLHCFKLNPRTGMRDISMTWDFIANHPESLLSFFENLSPLGLPRSYKNVQGHAVHTFQVENDHGHVHFVRFSWYPDAGIHNFTEAEVATLQGTSPDYHTEDLYNNIANGTCPSYTLMLQVVPKDDIEKYKFDLFDVTMYWPEEEFPYVPFGKLVLNENVRNFFAEVEQSAFNPGNLVPGIRGVDKLFESRVFIYRDAQIHRLGTGFNKIEINRPRNNPLTYNRDGNPPVGDNGGEAPNYYPNSFHGIVPIKKTLSPLYRPKTDTAPNNFGQIAAHYNKLSKADQDILIATFAKSLGSTPKLIQRKILRIVQKVDDNIASRLKKAISAAH